MKKILLRLSYLGTNYCGYQVQPNGISVQQRLNEAAKALFGVDCDIVGCSRTDSGVHAKDFCVTVSEKGCDGIYTSVPIAKIPIAMNNHLPRDISVWHAEEVSSAFHPRYDVISKEYLYCIWNSEIRNPIVDATSWHYPRRINDDALALMDEASKKFCGTKDFSAYMAAESNVKSTVRTVFDARVWREGDMIFFSVSADGFLYNMVRIFVGTLIGVAEGKIMPSDIDSITASKDRRGAGITAPAQGLFLNKVVY